MENTDELTTDGNLRNPARDRVLSSAFPSHPGKRRVVGQGLYGMDARSEETSDGAIARTLEYINALLDADAFTPPRLDPRAFVLEGF